MRETTEGIDVSETLDARGLQCPMPLVRASAAAKKLGVGDTLKALATDRGSVPDFQAWINGRSEYELLGQGQEQDGQGRTVYVHYIRRLK